MKSRSFDLYGGLLPAGYVSDNEHPIGAQEWPNDPRFWTGSTVKELPSNATRLNAVILSISTFKPQLTASTSFLGGVKIQDWSGLHAGVWLCWGEEAYPKEHDEVFAFANTGDSGAANIALSGLDLEIPESRKYTIGFWSHNMRPGPSDWHCNGILYFS